jgi:hypothetical protein
MLFLSVPSVSGINKALSESSEAQQRSKSLESRVSDLEKRADTLALACQALWELLSEKTGIGEDQVRARMREIDERDGHADGRIRSATFPCAKCGRTCSTQTPKCIYCGQLNEGPHLVR